MKRSDYSGSSTEVHDYQATDHLTTFKSHHILILEIVKVEILWRRNLSRPLRYRFVLGLPFRCLIKWTNADVVNISKQRLHKSYRIFSFKLTSKRSKE